MSNFGRFVGLGCAISLLGGCSRTLDVSKLEPAGPRQGIGYVLPYTQYAMAVTWRLDYCPDPTKPDEIKAKGDKPKIVAKVEATAGSADDGTLAFILNPQDLQSLTSVTSFAAKWQDGRNLFSTINASVEDRSAQVIGNIVKTATKVLPLAMGMPPAPGAVGTPPPVLCTDKAVEALAKAKAAKAALDVSNDAVEAATKTVAQINAKITAMGAAVDEDSKKQLGIAQDALIKATMEQSDASDAVTDTVKSISYTHKFQWPGSGDEFGYGPDVIPLTTLQAWIDPASLSRVTPKPVYLQIERIGTFGRVPARDNRTPPALAILLTDEDTSPVQPEAGTSDYAVPGKTVKGLRYRMPAAGRLVACSRSPCGSSDPQGVIASFDGPIVQLGYVNVLPFRSRAFGSNSFAAEFAADGSLKSVGYEQKAAPAEGATGAIADAATQLTGVFDPTARLQAKTAYLKALKDKSDALEALRNQAADTPVGEKAALDTDTSLLNARIANLQAQIALEKLKATPTQ